MHFMVQSYQFSVAMFKKVKQLTVMFVNVNQVSVTIIASSIEGENKFKEGVRQDYQDRQDNQDFSIVLLLSYSVLYLLPVFS